MIQAPTGQQDIVTAFGMTEPEGQWQVWAHMLALPHLTAAALAAESICTATSWMVSMFPPEWPALEVPRYKVQAGAYVLLILTSQERIGLVQGG